MNAIRCNCAVSKVFRLLPYILFSHDKKKVLIFFSFFAVPPEKVSIIDGDGNPLLQSVAGPYQEGDEMSLLCVVAGGEFTKKLL